MDSVIQLDSGEATEVDAPQLLQNPLCVCKEGCDEPHSPGLERATGNTSCNAEEGQNFHIQYETIPDLPEDLRAALRKHDTDKDGSISLNELINIARTNKQLFRIVMSMAVFYSAAACRDVWDILVGRNPR